MSQPDSSLDSPRGVLVPKPKTSIYTIMLIISLVAVVVACAALWLEVLQYGWPWEFPWKIPANLRSF